MYSKLYALLRQLTSADASPLEVEADIEVKGKVGGSSVPWSFAAIGNVDSDAILGFNFQTDASIDTRSNLFSLLCGITAVPMISAERTNSILSRRGQYIFFRSPHSHFFSSEIKIR
jgi:hypothetical protein